MTAGLSIRTLRPGESAACERILRSLPEWFGIEESLLRYVADTAILETIVAEVMGTIVGFASIRPHNVFSAEIDAMAVAAGRHGEGIGRALVEDVESRLRARGVEFLQVKTLGPSRPNEPYERTRGFYNRLGFRPLEENDLWGEVNPCLMLVKHLACANDATS